MCLVECAYREYLICSSAIVYIVVGLKNLKVVLLGKSKSIVVKILAVCFKVYYSVGMQELFIALQEQGACKAFAAAFQLWIGEGNPNLCDFPLCK